MNFSPFAYIGVAVLALTMVSGSGIAQAQSSAATRPAMSEAPAPARTGKERLGNKWSDEQRVDNCKVPAEKRGSKQRPDTCSLTH